MCVCRGVALCVRERGECERASVPVRVLRARGAAARGADASARSDDAAQREVRLFLARCAAVFSCISSLRRSLRFLVLTPPGGLGEETRGDREMITARYRRKREEVLHLPYPPFFLQASTLPSVPRELYETTCTSSLLQTPRRTERSCALSAGCPLLPSARRDPRLLFLLCTSSAALHVTTREDFEADV